METTPINMIQGKKILSNKGKKIDKINVKTGNNIDIDPKIEGFTGMFSNGSINIKNNQEQKLVDNLSNQYNKALSDYNQAEKALINLTNEFLSTQSSENQNIGSFVKTTNGKVGYVTDKGNFLYIPNNSVLNGMKGKNGCSSNINQIDGQTNNYTKVGSNLGTSPDFMVRNPISKSQSCAPTEVSLQVIGATNSDANTASWKGCYTNQTNWNDENISGTDREDIISQCQVRAADQGYPAFSVQNNGGTYSCYSAPQNTDLSSLSNKYTSHNSHNFFSATQTSDSTDVFALLFNGQIGHGSLANGETDISKLSSLTIMNGINAVPNCNALSSGSIYITNATYGMNCDGKGSNIINSGNWTDVTGSYVNGKSEATYTVQHTLPDPAPGCSKNFTATYTCTGNKIGKTFSKYLDNEANGKNISFDCSSFGGKCAGSRLSLGDDGNVTVTDYSGKTIWQSNTYTTGIAMTSKAASKSKYGRNYIQSGEFLRKNEFIGSPSGNCILTLKFQNGTAMFGLHHYTINCGGVTNFSSNPASTGTYGDVGNDTSTSGVYTMSVGNISKNPRKIVYVDSDMKKHAYSSSDTILGDTYYKIPGYNSSGGNLGEYENITSDDCTNKCTELSNCYGVVYNENNKKCWLKNSNMFPKGKRTKNNSADTYVRLSSVNNNNSCSKQVQNTTSDVILGLPNSSTMTTNYKCGLGAEIQQQQKIVDSKYKKLQEIINKVKISLNKITLEDNYLDKSLINQIQNLQKSVKEYDNINKKLEFNEKTYPTTNAMSQDAEYNLSSSSIQYMLWTTLAGLGVFAAIRASR